MFHFKRMPDAVLTNQVFHSPNNIGWMHADRSMCDCEIPYNPAWLYLGCWWDHSFVGCVFGIPKLNRELELHIAFTRDVYGNAVVLGALALGWLKINQPHYKTYSASIAPYNALAKRFVKNIGFSFKGHSPTGWLRDGAEYGKDHYIYRV